MQSVAFAPPVWAATLRAVRRLTRMAATALVLVVGLNGLTAPVSADPLGPVSAVRPLAGPRVSQGSVDASAILSLAGPVDAGWEPSATTARWASEAAGSATRHPRVVPTTPTAGIPSRPVEPEAAAPRPDAAILAHSTDPGRESVTRRGPPRA